MRRYFKIPLFILPIAVAASVLLPLQLASGLSLALVLATMAAITFVLVSKRDQISTSLFWVHGGVSVVVLGIVAMSTTLLFDGLSIDQAIVYFILSSGLLATSFALYKLARARRATSQIGDVFDAIAITAAAMLPMLSITGPYLASSDQLSRISDEVALLSSLGIFLFFVCVLIFGGGKRSVGGAWAALNGLVTVSLLGTMLVADVTSAPWQLQMLRFSGINCLVYAVALSHPSVLDLAKPGTHKQEYRWSIYAVALLFVGAWGYNSPSVAAVVCGLVVVVALILRLREAQITNNRLADLSEINSSLAQQLAITNSVPQALAAGQEACKTIVGDKIGVTLTTADSGSVKSLTASSPEVIASSSQSTLVFADSRLQARHIVALEQIANVVDFAVGSVDARAEEITKRARADWLEEFKHDSNTGLLNMNDFRAGQEIEPQTLIMFEFHDANLLDSTEGAESAEALMSIMATRLIGNVRSEDKLWRGDGGRLLVSLDQTVSDSSAWAEERRKMLSRALMMGPQPLDPTITAAVLEIEEPMRPDSALVRISIALGHARETNNLTSTVSYSDELESKVSRRWKIEASFGQALRDPAKGGFKVHYQPILDTVSGEVVAVEALARWTHPELGDLSPAEFIPAAERIGMVAAIDGYVLNTALADMEDLRSIDSKIRIQVNISPVALTGDRIREAANLVLLHRGRTTDSGVVFEMIESAIGDFDVDEITGSMQYCRDLGIELSVDDFGTGESNFDRMAKLPFTQIKLSNEFVQSEDTLLLESMLRTANDLGMDSIVEGVETKDQARLCVSAGATSWQGWLFSKALPIDELFNLLLDYKKDLATPVQLSNKLFGSRSRNS